MSDKKEPLNCEHCQKEFRSKSGLANHIKFCKEKFKIICQYCLKEFSTNRILNNHLSICNQKKILNESEKYNQIVQELNINHQKIVKDLNEEIFSYQTEIEKLKFQNAQMKNEIDQLKFDKIDMELKLKNEQINFLKEVKTIPTINNTNNYYSQSSTKISNVTNNVNNKLQLSEDFLLKLRNGISFRDQVFIDEEDICRWSLKNGLNNYFAVLDKSRKVLTFTDEKGNKIRDQDGVLLANKLFKEFSETIKNENAQDYLDSLNEDPNEMYVPTTLMKRKKLVQNVMEANEYSVQRLGTSIFKEYPRYEPKSIESDSKSLTEKKEQIETKTQTQISNSIDNKKFSIVKSKIKNLFYKYNFDPLNYGLYSIGGFLYQFLDELEIRASRQLEYIEIKDDNDIYTRFNDIQLFELLTDIFTEEDFVQITLKCKNEEAIRNLIVFHKVFILRQFENVDNIIENLWLGIRAAF